MDRIDEIAGLLPENRREDFYKVARRLEVSDEDEILTVIQMMAILGASNRDGIQEIQAISDSLKDAAKVVSGEKDPNMIQAIRETLREEVVGYEDLRGIYKKNEELLKKIAQGIVTTDFDSSPPKEETPKTQEEQSKRSFSILSAATGLLLGLSIMALPWWQARSRLQSKASLIQVADELATEIASRGGSLRHETKGKFHAIVVEGLDVEGVRNSNNQPILVFE